MTTASPETPPPSLEQRIADFIVQGLSDPANVNAVGLEATLRLLAKWRSRMIDQDIVEREGTDVRSGPFAGLHFVSTPSECSLSPKLLGGYEGELHPVIAEIAASDIGRIVDIGCADGYYAIGFARLMPQVEVLAYDTNPAARAHCAALAARNGVADRVTVSGTFTGEDFATLGDRRTLVFTDIEGAEDELLRPDLYPALRDLTVLVECHDVFKPGLSARMAARFAETHLIRIITPALHCPPMPSWLSDRSHLDQLLALWEWRAGPTPWLFLTPRRAEADSGHARLTEVPLSS